jgi:glycosyltransferase involved in cell wall biosynthesis
MRTLDVVLPNDIDDPASPSGGNVYDRRICRGLAAAGWSVREHPVRGAWPRPSAGERAGLARVLAARPDDAVVLIDGLVASTAADVLVPPPASLPAGQVAPSRRLRLVILMHMPLGEQSPGLARSEGQVLSAAAAVITTSLWSRQRLLDRYGLDAARVHAAPPGVDAAPVVRGSVAGTRLLCVAAVTPGKGHDVLVRALASIPERPWTCVCVGALDRDPAFADRVRRQSREAGLADRLSFTGPLTGADLRARYAAADLLVLPSRGETYGMVVTEALAQGTPVLATAVNGVPEALGLTPDGARPGLLVEADDPAALAGALRRWLGEPGLRRQLRRGARTRRRTLTGWTVTSRLVAGALSAAMTTVSVSR